MALTEKQKADILRFVYPPLHEKLIQSVPLANRDDSSSYSESNSLLYSDTIASDINNLSDASEAQAIPLLDRIIAIEQQLSKANSRLTVNAVGNIRLNRDEIPMLRREKIKLGKELKRIVFPFRDLSLFGYLGAV